MGIFDFIRQNAKILNDIEMTKDGEVRIDVDDFDFAHPDLQVEDNNGELKFTVEIGDYALICEVDMGALRDASGYLSKISDPDARRTVIEAIDGGFRQITEDNKESASETYREAQDAFNLATKSYNDVVDSLRDLKRKWNIP